MFETRVTERKEDDSAEPAGLTDEVAGGVAKAAGSSLPAGVAAPADERSALEREGQRLELSEFYHHRPAVSPSWRGVNSLSHGRDTVAGVHATYQLRTWGRFPSPAF